MRSCTNVGRRSFLRATGLSGVALTSSASFVSRTTAQNSSSGKLVFVYDDGPSEDYTKTFPVHQDEGVPGCVAAVSSRIGEDGSLTAEQLREIDSAGWEIMSHTVKHRAVGSLEVTKDIEQGATKIYVYSNRHGEIPGDRVRIFDSTKHEIVTVTGNGSDETGEFITLKDPTTESFRSEDTAVRYTDEILRTALGDSKSQLQSYGVNVSNFVLPYGINGKRARELIPEYYTAVANAEWDDGMNAVSGLDPYHLHRAYLESGAMTEAELGTYLDNVANNDVLGILASHSQYEEFTADRLRTAIRMAKQRNLEIVTLRQALADLGVVEPTTTTTTTTSQTPATTQTTTASSTPTETNSSETTTTSGQPGFGVATTLTGLGALLWRRNR